MHQLQYANYQLRREWDFPPYAPRGQAAIFAYTALTRIFMILSCTLASHSRCLLFKRTF